MLCGLGKGACGLWALVSLSEMRGSKVPWKIVIFFFF